MLRACFLRSAEPAVLVPVRNDPFANCAFSRIPSNSTVMRCRNLVLDLHVSLVHEKFANWYMSESCVLIELPAAVYALNLLYAGCSGETAELLPDLYWLVLADYPWQGRLLCINSSRRRVYARYNRLQTPCAMVFVKLCYCNWHLQITLRAHPVLDFQAVVAEFYHIDLSLRADQTCLHD